MYTISKDCALFRWEYMAKPKATDDDDDEDISSDEDMRWRIAQKHFFTPDDHSNVTCAAFHADSKLLVVGFANGTFSLYELPEATLIHNLRYCRVTTRTQDCTNGIVVSPRATLISSQSTKPANGSPLAHRDSDNYWSGNGSQSRISSNSKAISTR